MSIYPHTGLWLGQKKAVIITGSCIRILDSDSGDILHDLDKAHTKSEPIRSAAVDSQFLHLVTVGDDKRLKVWDIDGLSLLSEREVPKRPTSIAFNQGGSTIIVADKFGDVFSYPLHPPHSEETESKPVMKDELASHENAAGGTLILGHTSLLTSFILSEDEKYIITSDRDEHIRVSWYPQGYNIEAFCLGHREFVSAVHIPTFDHTTLVSGGGDPELRVWNWMSGQLTGSIQVRELAKPYIKVYGSKYKQKNEDDGEPKPVQGRRGRAKAKAAKAAAEAVAKEKGEEGSTVGEEIEEVSEIGLISESSPSYTSSKVEVFAIHKIASVAEPSHSIIFSVIGATALFACPWHDALPTGEVRVLNLGRPVLDFTVDGRTVWVLLDPNWTSSDETSGNVKSLSNSLVRLVRWTGDTLEEVVEAHDSILSREGRLLSSLNARCVISAQSSDLKALELYSALSSLPKRLEVDEENAEDNGAAKGKAKELPERIVARNRNRKAVEERLRAQNRAETEELDSESNPKIKRARSEGTTSAPTEDVVMD